MILKETIRKFHISWLRSHSARELSLHGRVVIVAPHPDDEVIGCGGLIARLVARGNAPHIVALTGGEGSHRGCCKLPAGDIKQARRGLTRQALQILGVPAQNLHELDFPDGGISAQSPEAERLKALLEELRPDAVLVPHWGEGWPDHINAAKIVKTITQASEVYEYCVWMWYYNVWRGLDWSNARRLKLTPEEHVLKLCAIDAYVKPLAPCGKPWSGVLPTLFLTANSGNSELYFKMQK